MGDWKMVSSSWLGMSDRISGAAAAIAPAWCSLCANTAWSCSMAGWQAGKGALRLRERASGLPYGEEGTAGLRAFRVRQEVQRGSDAGVRWHFSPCGERGGLARGELRAVNS